MRVKFIVKPEHGCFRGVEIGEIVEIKEPSRAAAVLRHKMAVEVKEGKPKKTAKRSKSKKENN